MKKFFLEKVGHRVKSVGNEDLSMEEYTWASRGRLVHKPGNVNTRKLHRKYL